MKMNPLFFALVIFGGMLQAENIPTKETDKFFAGSTVQTGRPEGCKIVWDREGAIFAVNYTALFFNVNIWVANECKPAFPMQARVYISYDANFKRTQQEIFLAQKKGKNGCEREFDWLDVCASLRA